jgi:GT2 family glycosyltransferase
MRTTVVMPVHGNWPVVERAVAALSPQLGPERELVIVDDASAEAGPDALPATSVLRNDENLGFGPSCNRGAEQARGEYLCFLNSDSLVEPGALDALEAAAASDERNGAIGSVLLDEDGAVQEAGCAIGREGTTYPLGRGSPVGDPSWSFGREVDYASAACLLVRRSEFEQLGGFDDRFAPGYYEDADLCLRLTARGFRTVVEPAARTTHLQYGSGSRERATALVARNRATFVERWGDRFSRRPIVVAAHPWPHREVALRDAIALTRFLVFGDAVLARDLADRWPGSRVTLVGGEAGPGIESAAPEDLDEWLEKRRYHYSAILGADERLAPALDRSQPQAVRVAGGRGDLAGSLAAAGVAPPGEEPRG